jgi:hypothetical protein
MESKSLIRKIISNPIIQTLAVYVSGSWVLIEITQFIVNRFELNETFINIFLVVLLCGLPVAPVIAWLASREKEPGEGRVPGTRAKAPAKSTALLRKPVYTIPGVIILLLLIVAGIRYFNHRSKVRWANEEAMPGIEQHCNEGNYIAAFNLIQKAGKYISEDPDFMEWESLLTTSLTILTDPPGAEVRIREYLDTAGTWKKLGRTPIDSIKMPNYTFYLAKIERSGYEDIIAIVNTRFDTLSRKLFPEGTSPPGMAYVDGYWDEMENVFLGGSHGFFMDRYEVNNKQFKEFVDNGGYSNPEYWKHEFIKEGKTVSFKEAMADFTDKTGRPGPAAWEAGDYPDGQDSILRIR